MSSGLGDIAQQVGVSTGEGETTVLPAPSLLTDRAHAQPGRTALMLDSGSCLTFGDWDRRAGDAAAGLVARRLHRGDRVALLFESDEWLDYAIAYMAVLRAGGVAVPLSARMGVEELSVILADCAPVGVIGAAAVPSWSGWRSRLGELEEAGLGQVGPPGPRPDELAQILYTSGTTGVRKGVGATHANLAAALRRGPRRTMAHSELLLHAFPMATNAAQAMLLGTLVAHPVTMIARKFEAHRFCGLIETHRVGSVFVVPAMANDLVRTRAMEGRDLGGVVLFGSTAAPLPPATALALSRALPNAAIVDTYTTTEAWPAQTTMIFDPARPSSVGRPADDEIKITDGGGAAVPAGTTGSIWLRAQAPSRSYVGDADASAQVFRDGWIRTGDLGYLDRDGYLHLVDRESDIIDHGGHNVSTLQVERALLEHRHISDAAVFGVAHPILGTSVAAAVVSTVALPVAALREFLARYLAPQEMPAHILRVDAIARNEAGKAIKRQLARELESTLAAVADQAEPDPRAATPTEELLRDLWRRVLGVRHLGPRPDFFALGGDSLRSMRLAEALTGATGVELPPSFALATPLLADQAVIVDAETARLGRRSAATAATAEMPASAGSWPMQEYYRQWLGRYDIPPVVVAVRIREPIDVAALEHSVNLVVSRHEALRTVLEGAGPPQVIENVRVALAVASVEHLRPEARESAAQELCQDEIRRPFVLAGAPLVRGLLVRLSPDDVVLVLTIHHFNCDGASVDVMLREIGIAYSALRAGRTAPLSARADSGDALAAREIRDDHPATRDYWERRISGVPAHSRPEPRAAATAGYERGDHTVTLPGTTAARLVALAQEERATAFVAAAAAWAAVIGHHLHVHDVVLTTPAAARSRPERKNVVGCLARDLLLRVEVNGDPTFRELLARVRRETGAALDNQHYPYAEYAQRVPHGGFNFEEWRRPMRIPGLSSERFDLGYIPVAEWPRGSGGYAQPALIIRSADIEWTATFVFNRRAVDPMAMSQLAGRFISFTALAVETPDQPIGELLAIADTADRFGPPGHTPGRS